MFRIPLLLCAALIAAAQETQVPGLRTVNSVIAIRPGPGNTIYVLADPRTFPPTPGAWMPSCTGGVPFLGPGLTLTKLDTINARAVWSTCLPLQSVTLSDKVAMEIDSANGAIIVAGAPSTGFRVTPGALNMPRTTVGVPGEELAIIRVHPDGTAVDYAAILASNPPLGPPFVERIRNGLGGLAILPDSSVVIASATAALDLPVTAGAIDTEPGRGIYVARLSSDGARIVYGTYLRQVFNVSSIALQPGNVLAITGGMLTASPGYPVPTAGLKLLNGEIRPAFLEGYVLRLDLNAPRLVSFARTGVEYGSGPRMASGSDGRLRLAMGTPAFITSELNESGTAVTTSTTHAFNVEPLALRLDTDGTWLMAVRGGGMPPATVASTRLPFGIGQSAVLRLDSKGERVLSSALINADLELADVSKSANVIYAAIPDRFAQRISQPLLSEPEPASAPQPAQAALFYAYPDRIQGCTSEIPLPHLIWDVRDINPGGFVTLHEGGATGSVIARGATGALAVNAADQTYTLVLNPGAGPFVASRVIGTVTTSIDRNPLRCAGVTPRRGYLYLPNPVLACTQPAGTGTVVRVQGQIAASDRPSFTAAGIRVVDPSGPVFVGSPNDYVAGETGDWIRTGLDFFLTPLNTPGTAFAGERAYVLPVRDCTSAPPAPPIAAIRATRDCANRTRFTLAFHNGTLDPVEIRTNSADGPVAGRLAGPSGLLDITTDTRTTYYLMTYRAGKWEVLATTEADPAQPCGQGRQQ